MRDEEFDNLVEMRVAEYDPQRAEDLLEALVLLCLDADARLSAQGRPDEVGRIRPGFSF